MNYYYKEFEKLEDEFQQILKDFPLFKEDIDRIFDKDIKEINELLEKQDEFYLKKAINLLNSLIDYIKTTSKNIDSEYQTFNKLASLWEKTSISNMDSKDLDKINSKIEKANEYIKSHNLKDLKYANKLMNEVLKEVNNY